MVRANLSTSMLHVRIDGEKEYVPS